LNSRLARLLRLTWVWSNSKTRTENQSNPYLPFTRSEFEEVIKEAVERTANMMKKILTRNSLRPKDLKFVLMVGGGTYIPYIRKHVEELMGIVVNTSIDPTNAKIGPWLPDPPSFFFPDGVDAVLWSSAYLAGGTRERNSTSRVILAAAFRRAMFVQRHKREAVS
jgi:hypothetical protein